jgi:GTP-binding protein EngB required for normal cell division
MSVSVVVIGHCISQSIHFQQAATSRPDNLALIMVAVAATAPKSSSSSSAATAALEIQLAIVGNAGVGKATVLNALLGQDYAAAAMSKRRAAVIVNGEKENSHGGVVHRYKIHVDASLKSSTNDSYSPIADLEEATSEVVSVPSSPWILSQTTPPSPSTDDSANKDADNSNNMTTVNIPTLTYDIATPQEIVAMRTQTSLTCTVLPGIVPLSLENGKADEASAVSYQFLHYLSNQWEQGLLDALIVVVDGTRGLSAEDELLLQLVQYNWTTYREIPIIILCNKVDQAEDKVLSSLVQQVRERVQEIFAAAASSNDTSSVPPPTFVPCSALHGYIYRAGSHLTVYQFEDFDRDLMEMIGKVYFGSANWNAMTHEERFRQTHAILAHPQKLAHGLEQCGWGPVLSVLNKSIGGAETQERLLQQQIEHALSKVKPFQPEWITYTIFSIYYKQKKVSAGSSQPPSVALAHQAKLREAFWTNYRPYQAGTFAKFTAAFVKSPATARLAVVADPIQELMYYHKLVVLAEWTDEVKEIVQEMKAYVRRYLHFLIRTAHETQGHLWDPAKSTASPIDWSIIWRSIQLLFYQPLFCEELGHEQIIIAGLAQQALHWQGSGLFPGTNELYCVRCRTTLDPVKKKDVGSCRYPKCKHCLLVYLPRVVMEGLDAFDCGYCGNTKVGGKPDNDAAADASASEDKFKCENCHYQHDVFVGLKEALEFSYSAHDGEQPQLNGLENESKLTVFPKHPDRYRHIVHLDIPTSLEDPMHFGHVLYKTFTFIASLSSTIQTATNTAAVTTTSESVAATTESAATVSTEAPLATVEAAPLEAEPTLPTSKRTKSPKKNGKKSSKSTAV